MSHSSYQSLFHGPSTSGRRHRRSSPSFSSIPAAPSRTRSSASAARALATSCRPGSNRTRLSQHHSSFFWVTLIVNFFPIAVVNLIRFKFVVLLTLLLGPREGAVKGKLKESDDYVRTSQTPKTSRWPRRRRQRNNLRHQSFLRKNAKNFVQTVFAIICPEFEVLESIPRNWRPNAT